ncbi:MAG TPA: hypothetical protein VFX86_00155 [Candidatus Saccharimonadales bacterium]|nr:hypothetical protein [Candidatus Saccharimonadales bacterium]
MARTAKKPSASKSKSKAATSKKVVKTAAAANKGSSQGMVTLQKLYKFNLFSAAANLIFAVLSILFVSKNTVDFTLAHAVKDEIASTSDTVLGPAYTTLATVEIRYLMAVIFLLGAFFSLLLATKLRKVYESGVKNSTSGVRWLLTGITFALILELVSVLGGVSDVFTLKLIAGLILATSILAWLAERENKGSKNNFYAFALSVFTGFIAWLPLAGSLIGTALYGDTAFDWHVYALAVLVLFGFTSIGLSQYRQVRDGISAKGYLQLEGKYVSSDFLIKLAVFAVLLLALHK